jgi:tRNA(adenine34) deaminase
MTTPLRENRHEWYMAQALDCAREAMDANEVPIGAVIVDEQGEIIARAANSMEHDCSQGSHAEIKALGQAGLHRKNWRLEGCWIYVTLEPCAMCMYACLLSRVAGIVYGAESTLYGYHLDNALLLQVYKKDTLSVVKGVCAQEALELLKHFFKRKRKDNLS